MNAIIMIGANAKEIAALVLAVQERQNINPEREMQKSERESLIRQYERRLSKLKAGASAGDIVI